MWAAVVVLHGGLGGEGLRPLGPPFSWGSPCWSPGAWSKPLTSAAGWGTAGTFAVISILVGNICLQLAPESKFRVFNNVTNKTYVDVAAMEAERLHVSATLACLTAIIQVTGEGVRPPCPCLRALPL